MQNIFVSIYIFNNFTVTKSFITMISKVIKRDYTTTDFKISKVSSAIYAAMESVNKGSISEANSISIKVLENLSLRSQETQYYTPTVEEIQDIVEAELMHSEFLDVAKAYILYRNEQKIKRKKNIFEKRINLKPYEYPKLNEYVDAIRHSYWIHTEFNFTSDVQDFKSRLTPIEKSAITNTMLAISQIEVAVKNFWGDLHLKMPKPEIGAVGATFAESEVRHHDAYSHLLEVLGLNEEFNNLKKNPNIMKRVHYLEKSLTNSKSGNNKEYTEAILLFSLFIEHVSLFSQFLIIMAFNKHKNMLKGISNVVEATSKEEQIHGDFGIDLLKIVKKENPDWFTEEFTQMIQLICAEAYQAETGIVNWIFEKGELDFLPVDVINEFIKNRFNKSLESIEISPIFKVDEALLNQTEWFDDEIIGTKHGDFFVKRSINYSKRTRSITKDDLF